MIEPYKFTPKTLSIYANTLMSIVFKNIVIVQRKLEEAKYPHEFIEVIKNEVLYYYLNICDRVLHDIYDHEIKTKIMNVTLSLIGKVLDEVKDDIMDEHFDNLTKENLNIYLKTLRTAYDSRVFLSTFNEKQRAYEGYSCVIEKPDVFKSIEWRFVMLAEEALTKHTNLALKDEGIKLIFSIVEKSYFYTQLYKVITKIEQKIEE